jgi:hypothetical protein
VHAQKGSILDSPRATPDGGWQIRYRAPHGPARDTLTVQSRRGPAKVELTVEPLGRVQLSMTVTPSPLLLDKGAHAEVKISVRDAAGRPARAPLRLGASVGRVGLPEEVAPGEYRAAYTPPDEKFPQVAILAALSVADGAFAAASCRLAAKVTVNGEGEPGATMQIAVDGKTFGPQTVPKDGHWALPIVVGPGSHTVGTSTDKLGNQSRHDVDLHLPPFPRLMLLTVPSELAADGHALAEVLAFAIDARGNPEKRAPPVLSASSGTLSAPSGRGDGATTWTLTAPASTGSGKLALKTGGATATVALRPAPPLSIQIMPPPEPLPAGSEQPASIEVRVRDAGGAPVAGVELASTLQGGRVLRAVEKSPGRYSIDLIPPRDPGRGTARLRVEVSGMRAGPPRRVTLHAAKAPAGHVAAEAWVDDDLGLPVPGAKVELEGAGVTSVVETDRFGTARIQVARPQTRAWRFGAHLPSLPGLAATLDELSVANQVHAVSGVVGRGVEAEREPPAESSGEADLPLRAAAPVDVRLDVERDGAGARLKIRLVDASGKPADGQILYQASAGRLDLVRPISGGQAELRFTPPPNAPPGSRFLVSVTEAKTRVTAFTEVKVP